MLSSRERVLKALNHQEADRLPLDLGGGATSGMHVSSVYLLRQALELDAPGTPVKVIEPFQMLGEIKPDLMEALGVDVVGLSGPRRCSASGTRAGNPGRPSTARRCWCPRRLTPNPNRTAISCCIRKATTPPRQAAACRPAAGISTPSSANRPSTTPTSTSQTTWKSSAPSPTRIWPTCGRGRAPLHPDR